MIKTYHHFKVEGEKEYIVYHYLNKIIRYLKECEVMEVFDNHVEAFDIMFHNIISFLLIANAGRSQSISLFHYEGEEPKYESSPCPCPYEECFETIMEKRKYLEVAQLLEDKIKHK